MCSAGAEQIESSKFVGLFYQRASSRIEPTKKT